MPAAVACATVPMAVLQASNAQSDLVTSFWLLCFVRLLCERRPYRAADVVWMGAALGLGIATKPTVLLFAPPFLAIIALRASRAGWRRGLGVPLAVVLVALLPGLPNTLRNVRTFGNALGPDLGLSLQRHDPGALASNVLRQAALSYPSINLWEGIAWLHAHVLHVDASDPATTVALTGFVPRTARVFLNPDENQVASPVHVTLALVGGRRGVAGGAAPARRLGVETRPAARGDRRRVPPVLRRHPLAAVGQSSAASPAAAGDAPRGLVARERCNPDTPWAHVRAGRPRDALRPVVCPPPLDRTARSAVAVVAGTHARSAVLRGGRAALGRPQAARLLRRAVPARGQRSDAHASA